MLLPSKSRQLFRVQTWRMLRSISLPAAHAACPALLTGASSSAAPPHPRGARLGGLSSPGRPRGPGSARGAHLRTAVARAPRHRPAALRHGGGEHGPAPARPGSGAQDARRLDEDDRRRPLKAHHDVREGGWRIAPNSGSGGRTRARAGSTIASRISYTPEDAAVSGDPLVRLVLHHVYVRHRRHRPEWAGARSEVRPMGPAPGPGGEARRAAHR